MSRKKNKQNQQNTQNRNQQNARTKVNPTQPDEAAPTEEIIDAIEPVEVTAEASEIAIEAGAAADEAAVAGVTDIPDAIDAANEFPDDEDMSGADAGEDESTQDADEDEGSADAGDEDEGEDDPDFRGILEALIFASDEPLTFKQIKELLAPNEAETDGTTEEPAPGRGRRAKARPLTITRVKRALDRLNAEFAESGRVFRIVEVAGGFAFQTTADYGAWVGRLFAERSRRRLTQSALETLAIIAFKQPISKPAIEGIRGVNAEYVVKSLLERNLISIVGREDSPGRPLLYGTTKNFLKHFGLSSINDLPKPREIKDLLSAEDELAVNPIDEMDPEKAAQFARVSSQELERLFDTARLRGEDGGSDETTDAPVLHVQFDREIEIEGEGEIESESESESEIEIESESEIEIESEFEDESESEGESEIEIESEFEDESESEGESEPLPGDEIEPDNDGENDDVLVHVLVHDPPPDTDEDADTGDTDEQEIDR